MTRDLHVWDPLGGRHSFSFITYIKVVNDPRFLLFCGLALVLFFATDPSGNREFVPLWVSAAIWPVSYAIYMSGYSLLMLLQSFATAHKETLRVPTSLIGFFALLPAVYLAENVILYHLSNGTYPASMKGNVLFYFLSVQVLEAVFFRFVFPIVLAAHTPQTEEADQKPDPVPESRQIIVGGERFPLQSIKVIEAREHHVEITTSDGQTRLRARLGDIVAQTTPTDGIQTHRSWWVARHAAKALGQEAGKPVLHLQSDRPVPVARTRMNQVQAWATEHLHRDAE
ncbi:LytTR family transcriptional regulator [Marivita sp. S6314]|uniref:LytTR family DNA-binding domain-containing protein n=1 Tax=Marivita sp. S6314 TaxID=2926406 RepID=UPI001FF60C15|nr:LytTR family DNA-binding domain-containing protein [Marivita sp. S6314]MCK0148697.1 LytTR family transcriptional regulator [Marivita sp. S6314]